MPDEQTSPRPSTFTEEDRETLRDLIGYHREAAENALAYIEELEARLGRVRSDLEAIRDHARLDQRDRGIEAAARYEGLADHALTATTEASDDE